MKFNYKARNQTGELQVGGVEASSRDAALNILSGHDLYVLSIEEVRPERWYDRILSFFNRVKVEDLMIFTREFATLIESQIPIADSLNNLTKHTRNIKLKETISEIAADVDSGFSLSQALSRHKNVFSGFYINMIKSAEITGRLSEVMSFLADYLENQAALTAKVRNAMIYPVFVVSLFLVVLLLLVMVVFPQIAPIFEETGTEVPIYTQIVITFGTFLADWWWALALFLVFAAGVLVDYIKTPEGKSIRDELLLRIPVFGKLFQRLYLARFAESARMLIKGGLTVPQAIEVTSHTIDNIVYGEALRGAAEKIRRGETLSKSLQNLSMFPPLVSQLIEVGESSGRLDVMLEKVNDFYAREVDDMVENLVALIQPILMLVIGIMVAFLFASLLLPLYSLSEGL